MSPAVIMIFTSENVCASLRILKHCNVDAYVIFDGGNDPDERKLPTLLTRALEKWGRVGRGATVLPLLAYHTFLEVLCELDVAHASTVFEGDREMAVLAKKWQCPVLSNDSDFFVYELPRGFIPIDTVIGKGLSSMLDGNGCQLSYLPVRRYRYECFGSYFQTEGYNFTDIGYTLSLLATLMGNDVVDSHALHDFYRQIIPNFPEKKWLFDKISSIQRWINQTTSQEDAFSKVLANIHPNRQEKVKTMLEESMNDYRDIEHFRYFNLEMMFQNKDSVWWSTVPDYYNRDIPDWVLKRMGLCEVKAGFLINVMVLHRLIFKAQVELLEEKSSYASSRSLRTVIYGIVVGQVQSSDGESPSRDKYVVEFDRKRAVLQKHYVKPRNHVFGMQTLPNLEQVYSMTIEERKRLLFASLGYTEERVSKGLSESAHLFMCITGLWYKTTRPRVNEIHIRAVILCILMMHINELESKKTRGNIPYSDRKSKSLLFPEVIQVVTQETGKLAFFKNRMGKFFNRNNEFDQTETFGVAHAFAQFQTLLVYTLHLNQVLLEPISLPSHSVMINCSFLYNFCHLLEGRAHAFNYLRAVLSCNQCVNSFVNDWTNYILSLSEEKPTNK